MNYSNDDIMLTTFNNPYDPFTNFDAWYKFDLTYGSDCCGILDRMLDAVREEEKLKKKSIYEEFVDDETTDELTTIAMNKIVAMHPTMYLIVHPGDKRYTLPYEEFKKTIPQLEELETEEK